MRYHGCCRLVVWFEESYRMRLVHMGSVIGLSAASANLGKLQAEAGL